MSPHHLLLFHRSKNLTFSPPSANKEWSELAAIADVIKPTSTNRADFLKECQSGAFDGIVAAYRTFNSVSITGLVNDELLSALPKSLKFLAHNGKPAAASTPSFQIPESATAMGTRGDGKRRGEEERQTS